MRLLILTSAPLSAHSGPQARLLFELHELSKLNDISIVCLGKSEDNTATKKIYSEIKFFHFPIKYKGWNVINTNELIVYINKLNKLEPYDLLILQMEIWDLMRELGKYYNGKLNFATILHAMPFLASPTHPTKNFRNDVKVYMNSGIPRYRKDYILKHHSEVKKVFKNLAVITNNATVNFYIKNYLTEIITWVQSPSLNSSAKPPRYNLNPTYDFVYIARMEKGKGVEYLLKILEATSILMKRKINVAIAGKLDDQFSKRELSKLLKKSGKSTYFKVTFFGWADEKLKSKILSNSGVFIYPSHYDNYPTVLLEAINYGLSCVIWDVPYAKLNYQTTSLISKVPVLDTSKFAKAAASSFLNRKNLFNKAVKFRKSFDSPKITAQKDTMLFNSIRKFYDQRS